MRFSTRNTTIFFLLATTLTGFSASAAKVGESAPDFTALDSQGKTEKLSDFKGKYVVLEWHNKDCPFVKKHYQSGNMQDLQKKWTSKGVVWLSVISSSAGKQGYEDANQVNQELQAEH